MKTILAMLLCASFASVASVGPTAFAEPFQRGPLIRAKAEKIRPLLGEPCQDIYRVKLPEGQKFTFIDKGSTIELIGLRDDGRRCVITLFCDKDRNVEDLDIFGPGCNQDF